MKSIRMTVGGLELLGKLNGSTLAGRIWQVLPCESHGETWGKEVYFPIDLRVENADPVEEVNVGDIAYWPEGPDLCLFFGSTPKSVGDKPAVASPVTVIGSFEFNPQDFHMIQRDRLGIPVRVVRKEDTVPDAGNNSGSEDRDQ